MVKDKKQNSEAPQEKAPKKTKKVRNRSNGKIELLVNNELVVFMPNETVEVPMDFVVPNGIGLYVKG